VQLLPADRTNRDWLGGAKRLHRLVRVAATQFGVGGDGQSP
jgi:hypothetical protein